MSSGFKITAVVLFSLAVVCAIVTVILYFAWNVRGIRDTLTGKTAELRIAELRRESGRWKTDVRRSEAPEGGTPWRASQIHGVSDSLDSSDLQPLGSGQPSVGDSASAALVDDENVGTTMLDQSQRSQTGNGGADGDEQLSTTLLNQVRQAGVGDDEGATTLLKGSKHVGKHIAPSAAADGEGLETTLLGGTSTRSADAGEEWVPTTLLPERKPEGGGRR
ncbi:hypothetical protein OZX62_07530 [Bifidobacterium sp. ESL0690]|uniref:hypothetical protein n=1 Tax=Bifidobacterium sp. ESL0690 TaxID=2983214 RepID=UPI0023F93BE6|nr:hypothetical protein [Bifidobacterium sp. ESL0690]WEV46289.1 hypothetical protein OZX62_07530 [Bifidobacterium sp. ESL0690]